ncbi:phosphoribosyltransferase [Desulfovibrio sp. X2]|uniref:phosphoribosyltransferase n=1 Tax=Desulfovibrio sp. X2 TaxID=941449 RepID=UPI000358CFF1|nr:phosphoribosyltransferase [Desulfovibrio sp. X2]EPR43980.1 phosphoribosyltransferase [Desulfovibrio sp. X2]
MGMFIDRRDAGRKLAQALARFKGTAGLLVLGLPRGGVPVAYEVALALDAPLDVFVVRKLGVPGNEEYAMGALAGGGTRVLRHGIIDGLNISERSVEEVSKRESAELVRREKAYRGGRGPLVLHDRTVILVDDGLATGSTMQAAVQAVRAARPASIVVAVPVAPRDTLAALERIADEVVCLATPEPFRAVGQWYDDFSQTGDGEVRDLLAQAAGDEAP